MTQVIPEYDGCEWPIDSACFTERWETLTPEVQQRAVALASSTLRRLTGYRVGGCPVTVRPSPKRQTCWLPTQDGYHFSGQSFAPGVDAGGRWLNNCGTCRYDSGEVALPPPVGEVHEVRVDGDVLSAAAYRVDGNVLVWMGSGDAPWPVEQDMSLPLTEPDTFSVTYLNSYPVDSLGAQAAGSLAMEFALACSGSSKCRLPSGVTSIARAGVSMEIATGVFPDGRTGIREVDAYLDLWNPHRLSRPPTVYSPDLQRPRVVRRPL